MKFILKLIGLGGGASLGLPAILGMVAAALVALGSLLWWANSAWEGYRTSLIDQGKRACKAEVDAATAALRKSHIAELQQQADDYTRQLQATERARRDAAAARDALRDEQKAAHTDLKAARAEAGDRSACALTAKEVEILNRIPSGSFDPKPKKPLVRSSATPPALKVSAPPPVGPAPMPAPPKVLLPPPPAKK